MFPKPCYLAYLAAGKPNRRESTPVYSVESAKFTGRRLHDRSTNLEDRRGGGPRRIGDILADLLARYRPRFPAAGNRRG
jgi:hypothetical protein